MFGTQYLQGFKVGVLWCVLAFFVSLQLDNGKDTQVYIYGLCSNTEYEVRVRSQMRGYNFGVFSDSIFILISNKGQFKHVPVCRFWKEGRKNFFFQWCFECLLLFSESRIPITAVLVFSAVGVAIILMLIIVSRQHKWVHALLCNSVKEIWQWLIYCGIPI